MKKVFIAIIFLLLTSVLTAHAQSPTPAGQTVGTNCVQLTDEAALRLQIACQYLVVGSPEFKAKACANLNNRCPAPAGTVGAGAPQTGARNGGSINTGTGVQGGGSSSTVCSDIKFNSFINILIWIKCIVVSVLIPLIFALALLFFLWGVFKFMAASDSTKKEEAKNYIWWGLVALFVMVSLWGIIKIFTNLFGFDAGVPLLQTSALDSKNITK